MTDEAARRELIGLTVEIVAAHVSKSTVGLPELPGVIEGVYRSLLEASAARVAPDQPVPAVPVRKSVTPDYIVCLEDGKKLKMLKRHINTVYGLSPDQYRERWGLSRDYPMVAPNYARQRSKLAKQIGLGTRGRGQPPAR